MSPDFTVPSGFDPLGPGEQGERPTVAGRGADVALQPQHRLGVVVEHLGFRRHHRLERRPVTLEVGDQHLDRTAGHPVADPLDGLGEDGRSAVGEIVTVHRRQHGVLQTHLLDRLGGTARLVEVDLTGAAGGHVAEGARPGAPVAEQHQRRRSLRPALVDVGTAGFLAHGVELHVAHQPLEVAVALGARFGLDTHPLRPFRLTRQDAADRDRHLVLALRREHAGRNHLVDVVGRLPRTPRERSELDLERLVPKHAWQRAAAAPRPRLRA